MKLNKLFLLVICTLILTGGSLFAQNNDIKARIEYEDAETAYQDENYEKVIVHLDNTENLLGKVTAKTEYLRILSLNKLISKDSYQFEHLQQLRNYSIHYIDNFGEKIDTEKFREVYALNKKLENYPKTKEELEAIISQEKVAIETKKDKFLAYKALSYYKDGSDPSPFKQYYLSGVFSYKDKKTKKRYYILGGGNSGITFNENKISYSHYTNEYGDITTSQIEKLTGNFLKEMNDFSEKYALEPEIKKTNSDGWEVITYKYFHKNKSVQFTFSTGSYKGQLQYLKSINVTNHNLENK